MKVIKIGEVAKVFNGYAFKSNEYSDVGYQVIRITNVQNGYISNDNQKFIQLPHNSLSRFILNVDDILISLTGNVGRVGKVTRNNLPAVLNQRVGKLEINSKDLNSDYLFNFLRSTQVQKKLVQKANGIAQKNIGSSDIENIEIPLPTLEEQKMIVRKLDQADSFRQKRKASIQLLADYIDSVFVSMFVKNTDKKNIPLIKLEKITTKITDGVHFRPKYTESGVPFISVTNITNKKLDFYNCKFVSFEDHQKFVARCKPELGDILYTKVGATYGRACVVDDKREFSLYVSVALIKPIQNVVTPSYLKAVLNSSFVKHQADKSVKGAGVPDLHLIEIKNFDIPLPKIEDQNKFTAIVQNVEGLKQKMLVQSDELETQFEALMQKSFSIN